LRKYLEYEDTDHPLRIKSVVCRETLKGYIYIEARSMGDVQSAIDKVNNVYASKIVLVPRDEMTDVLAVKARQISIKAGAWVRPNRGKYKGDLAQVVLDQWNLKFFFLHGTC
jgi:transcription elongation factor SPT5